MISYDILQTTTHTDTEHSTKQNACACYSIFTRV